MLRGEKMKYTIHGFSQERALQLGLDEKDLMILRWFIDYKDTGKMVKKIINDDMYYWIKYEGIIEAFPIVKWKKDTVYRRLINMVKVGVLKHTTLKQGGVWSYYSIGEEYIKLTDTSGEILIKSNSNHSEKDPRVSEKNPNQTEKNPRVSEKNPNQTEKNPRISEKNPNQTDLNPERKTNLLYSSINNSSINNNISTINSTYCTKEQFKEVGQMSGQMSGQTTDKSTPEIEIEIEKEIEKEIELDSSTNSTTCCTKEQLREIVKQWNSLNLQRVMSINKGTNRYKMIHTRIKEYGFKTVLQAIDNIRNSSFLRGQNKRNWIISFDWFIKPNNFIKVLEDNYKDKDKEVKVCATGGIGKDNKPSEVKFDFSRFSDDSGEWNGEDIETEY